MGCGGKPCAMLLALGATQRSFVYRFPGAGLKDCVSTRALTRGDNHLDSDYGVIADGFSEEATGCG
jgi:hypothetical protein